MITFQLASLLSGKSAKRRYKSLWLRLITILFYLVLLIIAYANSIGIFFQSLVCSDIYEVI